MKSLLIIFAVCILSSFTVATVPIPKLDSKGDVYKTLGENDQLIYTDALGRKKCIMLYVDFPDAEMNEITLTRMDRVLGRNKFNELFAEQSYGKLSFDIKQVHEWRRLPKSHKEYSSKTTESHRQMFVEIFDLYPEINFLDYEYIMVNMPKIGNTAFGERAEIAIPYKDSKIKVALNISTPNPYVLAHETAHLMGLPDLYTYGGIYGFKNPAGPWDIMSNAYKATGFLGWHRHKLEWLDDDRKTYLTAGKHCLKLSPLSADSGLSMLVFPVDDASNPSKVFCVEVAQPVKGKGGKLSPEEGILIYSVDAKIFTGRNPLVVYPKTTVNQAPFFSGDTFTHEDAPMTITSIKRNDDNSYTLEIELNK